MKRLFIGLSVIVLAVLFFSSCSKEAVKTEPQKEEPKKIEKVEEVAPKVEKPQLTEEELFQQSSLDELNKKGYLQTINFDFDKYDIREDMKPKLEKNAQWLSKFPTVLVSIGGHCDEKGTEEYNLALGEKRANVVKSYLISLGVKADRLAAVSYGKSMPLVKNSSDEESSFLNRRAEFTITKK